MKTKQSKHLLAVVLTLGIALPVAALVPSAAIASILYAVTGDGGSPSESLFTLDQINAAENFVLSLGNGTDGETIGYNPTDGLIYHASGHTGSDVIFESINSTFTGTTDIPIDASLQDEEAQALTWDSSRGEFLWKQNHGTGPLYSVTTGGAATLIGDMDHQAKGLGFVGNILYSVDQGSDLLRTIDASDASTSSSIPITLAGFVVEGANGLAIRPEDSLIFAILKLSIPGAGNSRHLATIDPSTGIATDIGELSTGYAGLAFAGSVVPVPAAVWLFGTALIGLVGFGKRRKAA